MARKRYRIGPVTLWIPEGYERPKLPWKRKWIAALRSGKFNQTVRKLFDGVGYCCLGILSKIQGRLFGNTDTTDSPSQSALSCSNPTFGVLKGLGVFPEEIRVTLKGYGKGDGFDFKLTPIDSLATLNDKKVNFNQIASVIHLIWKE